MIERTVALIELLLTVASHLLLLVVLTLLAVRLVAGYLAALQVAELAGDRLESTERRLGQMRDRKNVWRSAALAAHVLVRDAEGRAGGDGPAFAEAYRQGLVSAEQRQGRAARGLAGTRWLPADDEARWFTWYDWLRDRRGLDVVAAARTATQRVFGVDPAAELGAAA